MENFHLIIAFCLIIPSMLAIDLFLVGRNSHKVSAKEAGIWTFIWVALSLLFAAFIWQDQGQQKAVEFLTAYTIEKALSVDNLFVFIIVFQYFAVPDEYHHKVLFWGIMGAIIMRAIFIFTGVALITSMWWLVPIFGVFLIWAGIKTFRSDDDEETDYSKSMGARLVKKIFGDNITKDYQGDKFFIKERERIHISNNPKKSTIGWKTVWYATPLLVVVAVIEFTDLLFAVDSIPAIFAVSKDAFILYSSNIFAILGLRTMYFLLANFMHLFRFLKYGLAIILTFIGIKMVVSHWYHIDSTLSLIIVAGVLFLSTILSVLVKEERLPSKLDHELED